jgi:hypothetical protein
MRPDSIIYATLLSLAPLSAGTPAAPQAKPASPTPAKPEPQALSLEIRVLDGKAQPVPQATVRVFTRPFRALLTDATGTARISDLKPGSYRVNAGKAGFKLSEQTVSVQEGGPSSLEFRLEDDAPAPARGPAPSPAPAPAPAGSR